MDTTKALQNLLNGTASEEDISLLKHGLMSGEISIGGNINQSVIIIIIGSGNTVELPPAALDRFNTRLMAKQPHKIDQGPGRNFETFSFLKTEYNSYQ